MKHLILGSGYVGKSLAAYIKALGHEVFATSRSGGEYIHFELEDKSTWFNIPGGIDRTILTLAVRDSSLVSEFLKSLGSKLGRMVFISTTSAFKVSANDQTITETSELDLDNPRVQAETQLLKGGAVCIFASGIYGPGRSPLRWVKEGRVGKSERFVNFIHRDDLVNIIWNALCVAQPGTKYIGSDCQPMRWRELISEWEREYGIKTQEIVPSKRQSKKIDATKTLNELKIRLKYKNVIEGVRSIEND
jgi:nucleoside-diphosphate-sugar epimerase